MSDLSTANAAPVTQPRTWPRITLRWMVSFLGFPLGGFLAFTLIGPVDSLGAALGGGLLTGAVLGPSRCGPWVRSVPAPRPGSLPPASA